MALQIGRRGHQQAPAGRQHPGHQARVAHHAMAQHRVEALGRRVHAPVVQLQRQRDAGVACQKGVERRSQVHAAEGHRRGQAHGSGQLAAALAELGGGLVHLAQDARRARQKGLAVLGQAEPACAAVEQRRGQRALQLGQAFADHRLGQVLPARGRAQRTGLRDGDETGNAVQLEHGPPRGAGRRGARGDCGQSFGDPERQFRAGASSETRAHRPH